VVKPRSLRIAVRPTGAETTHIFDGSIAWVLIPVLLAGLFVAGAVVTFLEFRGLQRGSRDYASLVSEVESLRQQSTRLALLESELTELRELQKQMLRLAGIEAALGVDLELLEQLQVAQAPETPAATGEILIWPVRGPIQDSFTLRHPGIDITAPRGKTVVSAGNGVVSFVGIDPVEGQTVRVRHNPETVTGYGNLALSLVDPGDTVRVGQVLGVVGADHGGDAHLHFEIVKDGERVDPVGQVPQPGP